MNWDEDVGSSIRFSDLQAFLVILLPALRDVESDLRQFRSSPLARLIDAMEIDPAEQDALIDALKKQTMKLPPPRRSTQLQSQLMLLSKP